MSLAFVTFLFLYAVIWLFERKRVRVDPFRIGVVAVVPVALMLLFGITAAMIFGPSAMIMVLTAVVLAVATFVMLWQVMGISPLRSVGYVLAVIAFHAIVGMGVMALGVPDQLMYGDWEWPS